MKSFVFAWLAYILAHTHTYKCFYIKSKYYVVCYIDVYLFNEFQVPTKQPLTYIPFLKGL